MPEAGASVPESNFQVDTSSLEGSTASKACSRAEVPLHPLLPAHLLIPLILCLGLPSLSTVPRS